MKLIDQQTFELFKKDHPQAFAIVFKTYYPLLVASSFRVLEDEAAAQEVAADSLIYLNNHKEKIDSPLYLYNYLNRVAKSKSLDIIRHQKVESQREKEYLQLLEEKVPEEVDMVYAEYLQDAYNSLPKKTKLVVQNLYLKQKSYRQLAEELHTTVKNIENIRKYGLDKIRDYINLKIKQSL